MGFLETNLEKAETVWSHLGNPTLVWDLSSRNWISLESFEIHLGKNRLVPRGGEEED